MEMLDAIGLGQKIAQQCFAVRTSVGYDGNGNEVKGRGWSFVEDIQDTKWNFATVCRQKYVEEIYRGELDKLGVHVHAPAEFKDLEVDKSVPLGGHRITATILDGTTSDLVKVKCKYLIGSDGSRTAVRRAALIDSDGDSTEDRWVRIDGMLTTDMPKSRSYGAIESPAYGNVLWIPLDHGATRIGYHLTEERWKHYGGVFNQALAVSEAQEAVKPFKIEFSRVDWASIYFVGQRVAKKFFTQGCVFLAGDACHTHSSGAGQGMNAGTHDAINLAWKLSLVLRGIAKPSLLETYEHERRPNAQKLINYDKDISVLISKRLPKSWTGDPNADPNAVLGQILQEAKGFNTGLAIGYERNILNVSSESPEASLTPIHTCPTPATPGYRAPDALLITPATFEPVRLHTLIPNNSRFYVILFTGNPTQTRSNLAEFTAAASSCPLFATAGPKPMIPYLTNASTTPADDIAEQSLPLPISFLTILATQGPSVWEQMGDMPAMGDAYFDFTPSGISPAHERYEVPLEAGALLIIRPDGWVGMRVAIGSEAVRKVHKYFGAFLVGVVGDEKNGHLNGEQIDDGKTLEYGKGLANGSNEKDMVFL